MSRTGQPPACAAVSARGRDVARPDFNYPGGRPWSDDELAAFRVLYPNTHNLELAALFGRSEPAISNAAVKHRLRKSPEYKAAHSTKFTRGLVTWNTGMRYQAGGRARETQFKPGQKPWTWMPVGSLRVNKDGHLQRKISDDPGGPHKRWRTVAELVWVEHNGPLPRGHIVVFKEGQFTDQLEQITIDRVECITRAELMRRNSVWTRLPRDVARLVQLRGALNRQINRISRN